MAFNGAFLISQGTDVHSFILTDTSTGSDGGLTDRRIYLYLSDGSTLVPVGSATTYIDWPIANGPITISLLDKDYALNIDVEWISSSPLSPPSTYSLTILKAFTSNSEAFLAMLTTMLATNRLLLDNNNFFYNKMKVRGLVDDATFSADNMNNIDLAQDSLNEVYKFILNQSTYF